MDKIWLGTVQCALALGHSGLAEGYSGAFVVFACAARDVATCVALLQRELAENALTIIGFDHLIDKDRADRPPSGYEQALIDRLDAYPVQFENVHLYKTDS